MARREDLPHCTQLLHVAARTRGDAARDLCRLAAAWAQGRVGGGVAVRASRRGGDAGAVDLLCHVRKGAAGGSAVRRHQSGGAGHRGRSVGARRQTGAQGQHGLADRRGGICRDVLFRRSVSGDRHCGGAGGVLAHGIGPASQCGCGTAPGADGANLTHCAPLAGDLDCAARARRLDFRRRPRACRKWRCSSPSWRS